MQNKIEQLVFIAITSIDSLDKEKEVKLILNIRLYC